MRRMWVPGSNDDDLCVGCSRCCWTLRRSGWQERRREWCAVREPRKEQRGDSEAPPRRITDPPRPFSAVQPSEPCNPATRPVMTVRDDNAAVLAPVNPVVLSRAGATIAATATSFAVVQSISPQSDASSALTLIAPGALVVHVAFVNIQALPLLCAPTSLQRTSTLLRVIGPRRVLKLLPVLNTGAETELAFGEQNGGRTSQRSVCLQCGCTQANSEYRSH